MKPNYLISIARDSADQKGTIHDPYSKLKIRVIDMAACEFQARPDEVQYFVTDGPETLAFETQGYNRHRTLLILQMVASYCVYLGLSEARIHATLPVLNLSNAV